MADYSAIQSSSPSNLVDPSGAESNSQDLAFSIAAAADDRKGENVVVLGVEGVSYLADYFVMVTGFSKAQVRAISQSIQTRVEEQCQRPCLRVEGQAEGVWILLDYGDVIAHVMMPEEREFYNLEAFWGHAERIEFPLSTQDAQD